MEKFSKSRSVYFLYLIMIGVFPFIISRSFVSVNDLPKNSALVVFGCVLLTIFVITFSYSLITRKSGSEGIFFVPELDIPVMLFLTACIISAIFSVNPPASFRGSYERQIGLITFIYLTIFYFLSGFTNKEEGRVKSTLLVIESVTVIISVYAILQFFKIELLNTQSANSRPGSFLGNSVFLGGFLVLILPFSVLNSADKKNKLLMFAFPFLIFIGIIVTGTRSAYIALAVQVVLFSILKYKRFKNFYRKKRSVIIAAVLMLLLVMAYFLFSNDAMLYQRILNAFNFGNPRFLLWAEASNIFFKYPITGPGIAMFPAALEEFYSNTLRYADALVTYDHAHNNYLHVAFTMGLFGLLAYVLLIYSAFRSAIRISKYAKRSDHDKKLSNAFVFMLIGYCVYGLTNFDDVSILFYLFIMLSALRVSVNERKQFRLSHNARYIVYAFSAAAIIFSVSILKNTLDYLKADAYFNEANKLYDSGEFAKAIDANNKAIDLNPGCAAYRFVEAQQVYDYCAEIESVNPAVKKDLLIKVEQEIDKAKKELYYVNYCNGLLSLVYFEQGRVEEGERLKQQVLARDSINLNYRLKLGRYLVRQGRLDEALSSLNILLFMRPKHPTTLMLAALYYDKRGDRINAVKYAEKILQFEPNDVTALNIIRRFKPN